MCESAPVANNAEFRQLANDLAKQLATGPGADNGRRTARAAVPLEAGQDARRQQKDDLFNRMREVIKVGRIVRIDGPGGRLCPSRRHARGDWSKSAAGTMRPPKTSRCTSRPSEPKVVAKEDLDPADVEKEREILSVAAREEGKPENIIAKMVEGRLRNFYSERVLLEQPFVKDDKQTVGQMAKKAGMTIKRFVRWELGK